MPICHAGPECRTGYANAAREARRWLILRSAAGVCAVLLATLVLFAATCRGEEIAGPDAHTAVPAGGWSGAKLIVDSSLDTSPCTLAAAGQAQGGVRANAVSALPHSCAVNEASLAHPAVRAHHPSVLKPFLLYGVAGAADLASTRYVMSRPGGYEAWLPVHSLLGQAMFKGAATVAMTYGDYLLQRTGRRGLVLVVRAVVWLWTGYLVAHNVRVGRGM
jgi:hypothetical protein